MNNIPIVEDLITLNILPYDIDVVDGNIIGELARGSVQKYENIERLQRYNNHICHGNNINEVFQFVRCPDCDTFLNRTFNLEQNVTTCSENEKNFYPKKVYKLKKLRLTSWTLSELNTLLGRKFSRTWLYSTLNRFPCKKKISKAPIQQTGLKNIFPSRFPSLQIL